MPAAGVRVLRPCFGGTVGRGAGRAVRCRTDDAGSAPSGDAPSRPPREREPREKAPKRNNEPPSPEDIGKVFRGKVVTTKEFGAFVEYLPGKEGLCHVSELANFRVKQTEDIVKVGDEIWVKLLGCDEKGRVRLSRKAAMEERDKEMAPQE